MQGILDGAEKDKNIGGQNDLLCRLTFLSPYLLPVLQTNRLLAMVRNNSDYVEHATPFSVKHLVRDQLDVSSLTRAGVQTVGISEIDGPEP